jgi:hypothetical protein
MNIYCTQLGMVAEFSYCLSMNEGMPCKNSIGCWRDRVDIMKVLDAAFTAEELRRCFEGLPKTRMERMIEVLRRVKEG